MTMRDSWRRTDDPPPSQAGQVGGVPYHTHPEYANRNHAHPDGELGCFLFMIAVILAALWLWVHALQVTQDQLVRLECAQHPVLTPPCQKP